MAAHAHLKNGVTEDEKYHNRMTWLICMFIFVDQLTTSLQLQLPLDDEHKDDQSVLSKSLDQHKSRNKTKPTNWHVGLNNWLHLD